MYYYNKNNKFSNQKVTIDGETFDSKREAKRYCELKLLERAGEIRHLRRQEKFLLIPSQFEEVIDAKGKPISNAQQYKMAGNSITVDVLYYNFKNLFVEPVKIARQMSIFDVL